MNYEPPDASRPAVFCEVLLQSRRVARAKRFDESQNLDAQGGFTSPGQIKSFGVPRTAKPCGANFAEEIAKQLAGN